MGELETIINFTRLSDLAFIPTKATPNSAGYDLRSPRDYIMPPSTNLVILLDLAIEIEPAYHAVIYSKSGLAVKYNVHAGAGLIDADYRGNLGVLLNNENKKKAFQIWKGRKIAQLVITPTVKTRFVEVSKLEKTLRGGRRIWFHWRLRVTMAPQTDVWLNEGKNVTPKYTHVQNNPQLQFVPGLQMESHVLINMYDFYSQHYKLMREFYTELLLTGKDILINEYKYASNYRLVIIFVPKFSENYIYKEIVIFFKEDVKPQFDKMVRGLIRIFRSARQLDDSPFSQITFR